MGIMAPMAEKKTEGTMDRQLTLVELAAYGYVPGRVNRGSWLERTFGTREMEAGRDGRTGRPDKDKEDEIGR